jgi:hypothetical protein
MSRTPPLISILSLACITLLSTACQSPKAEIGSGGYEDGFQQRRTILIDTIADDYKPTDYSDRGKYSFPKVIARIEKYGLSDEEAAGYLQEYADGKYGFFHFPFVGIARIMEMYPEVAAVEENEHEFLKRILLYDPEYHYNALTGEGTENHISMSRTNGYLFAQAAMEYEDLESVAAEWSPVLKEWIEDWSKRIYAYGTGEWDSNPYTAYNLVGWLNLYDFADDPEVRLAAQAVLDYYASNIALKYTQGLLGGPESRGSRNYGPLSRSATEYLGWLWFGPTELSAQDEFFKPSEYIQAIYAATSTYRPPVALMDLALKEIPKPAVYHNSKPNYQLTERAQSHEVYRIDDTFTLGTVQAPYGGWINTAYGVINWKLIIENNEGAPAVILGNGGMKSPDSPRGRNPFDQFLQYGSVVVQMTRVPGKAEEIQEEVAALFKEWRKESNDDFNTRWGRRHQFEETHVSDSGKGSLENATKSIIHLPEEMDFALVNNWAFTRYADTYISFRTLSGLPPELMPGQLIDQAQRDEVAGFVTEVANANDHTSFEAFIRKSMENNMAPADKEASLEFHYNTLDGDSLVFTYSTLGTWEEMIVDWGSGVEEKRIGFNTRDWKQPDWPSGEGHGRIPDLMVNGAEWPKLQSTAILSGPFLHLEDSILKIEDTAGHVHCVDYSADTPVFSFTGK